MRALLIAACLVAVMPASSRAADDEPPATGAAADPPPALTDASAVAPAASAAPPAAAPPPTSLDPSANQWSSRKPLKVGVGLDHSVGTGTFARSTSFALITARLSVVPSYDFGWRGVKLSASAKLTGSYEYTPPDNSLGRRYGWDDIRLELSAPKFFTEKRWTGISFSANFGASIPISQQSWWTNVITGVTGGLSLSRKIDKLTLGGRVGASKTFFSSLERRLPEGFDSLRDAQGNLLYICRSSPSGCLLSGAGPDGVPPLWALSGGVSARYEPREKISLSASFSMGKTWKYPVPVDDLSTRAVTSEGIPRATAQGQSDRMIGSLGASYQLTDAISVALEMGTVQSPLTADGKALRFPFFAFRNIEDSLTSYSLSFSGSY